MALTQIIIGLGLLFFFAYIYFGIDSKIHAVFKIILIFLIVSTIMVIGQIGIEDADNCDVRLFNVTETRTNTSTSTEINTSYGYNLSCFPDNFNSDVSLFLISSWFSWLLLIYMLIALFWITMRHTEIWGKIVTDFKQRFKKE